MGLLTLALGMVASMLVLAAPAQALAAPTGLTPSGVTINGNPILQWSRVAGATSYQVDITNDDSFATNVITITTTNKRVTPTTQLRSTPTGEIFWRVRAIGSTGTSTPATASFFRQALGGPTLISPTPDQTLSQPSNPPVLSWSPVPGAVTYTVQVDTDDSFVAPLTVDNKTTSTTSYLIPTALIAQPYHWRVKATLGTGVETGWSEIRAFQTGQLLASALVSPDDNAETKIVDVVLDWTPVRGAVKYSLQVSTDENFLGDVTTVDNIVGTRYSPPTTLGNDQYWWRVRPFDAGGNFLDWSAVPIWTFQRHWPDQPVLDYPANGDVVGNPFYFQWEAVPHASSYRIEMHTSADFEPADEIVTCTTTNTTFVPTPDSDCWPGAANSYYWRVVALDEPRIPAVVTDRIVSQVEYFHYLPDMVDLTTATPANNATVTVPTLSWDAVPGAAKYRVFVTKISNGSAVVNAAVTTGTSFTPRALLTVGESYRWWVQTMSGSGRLGPGVVPAAQKVFTVAAMPAVTDATPEPVSPANGISVVRFPTLTWTPVVGADRYKIGVRPAGSIQAFTELPDTFSYPAGEDDGSTYMSLGTFEWIVNAYDGGSYLSTSGVARSFVMGNLAPVTGHSVALTGTASGIPATRCADVLPELCQDMKATPVLRWNPVSGAGFYKVTLSRDAEMTSIISTTSVDDNMFIPTASLADSQAGAAYHWFVQPCKADSKCSPLGHATNAFNKRSNGVELISPANSLETKVPDTVTFTWTDWLSTNSSVGGADPVTGVNPRVEARQYRIQVATDEGFQNVIDSADVDQTTYTAYNKAYPEGPLYWRVYAIDGSRNVLTSSEVWRLDKESPTPELVSPIGSAVINQTAPFRWKPLDYAGGYELEVNKDNDDSSANRIIFASSKLVAYTAADPLPASAKAYLWRVRAVNPSSGKGDWSTWGRFYVKVTAPGLTSPGDSAYVPANDALFSWKPVAGAANYKFERRLVGNTSMSESVKTVALAWAPTSTIADGFYEWRVSGYDTRGQLIGTSAWRRFRVDATKPVVVSKTPSTTAFPTANFVAKFSEKVTGASSTTMKLYLAGRTSPLPAPVTLSSDGKTATLNPAANLVVGKYYTVKLSSGIKDLAGNALVATSWKVKAK